jgi:hypothetical protein
MVERVATYFVVLLNSLAIESSSPPSSIGPMRREDLVGLAPEQQVERLAEHLSTAWPNTLSVYGTTQPPNLKPRVGSSSGPPGACITPSNDTNAPVSATALVRALGSLC